MKATARLRTTESCTHGWGHLRRSITGMVCSGCGQKFKGDQATGLVLKVAEEALESAFDRIEALESIVSDQLHLTTCQTCGCWFKKKTVHGVQLKVGGGDVHLCINHVAEWFADAEYDEEQMAEIEIQLARWLIKHSADRIDAVADFRAQFGIDRMRGQLQATIQLQAMRLP